MTGKPKTVDRHPDAELIASLAALVHGGLRDVLRGARRVALVNFPNHGNPGDPAIWLGTREALRRLRVTVAYQCAWDTFSPEAIQRVVPDGPVLINGGGNFGDLYAGQQSLRERLLVQLRGTRLIQLPQSIHFRDPTNLERMRRLVANHGDFTLIVRELRSEALARRYFDADVRVLPDMALTLGLLPQLGTPRFDVTWLHRRPGDPEYVDHGGPPAGANAQAVEWIGPLCPEPPWRLRHRLARRMNIILRGRAQADPRWARLAWRPLGATFEPLARGWVRRGLNVLASGKIIVTDKLHGHILAMLAGIPHVLLDSGYGKVRAVYDTWTHPSQLAHWAADGDSARALALELLGATRRATPP